MQMCASPNAAARRGVGSALLALAAAACSPTLDWRESRPEGTGVAMLFPCRPEHQERVVRVGDAPARIQLHTCQAGGSTFSLAVAETADPAQVTPLLAGLRAQAIANLGGNAVEEPLPALAGATPNPQSAVLRIDGRRLGGQRVVAHAAFFVKGLRLYQATVLGDLEPASGEAVQTFLASIRLP